ncbi:hypothetical protein QR680_000898 [Steinernema hermaphroditum]|uniref:Uncharacterized protein n=1 Tax=Steinernema hermaphroditum TaxID=289476 RepID=A0AA39GX37_9BILA|nr:hypothetical protein QR680_000898 [Steinernema hermaphroditum]
MVVVAVPWLEAMHIDKFESPSIEQCVLRLGHSRTYSRLRFAVLFGQQCNFYLTENNAKSASEIDRLVDSEAPRKESCPKLIAG